MIRFLTTFAVFAVSILVIGCPGVNTTPPDNDSIFAKLGDPLPSATQEQLAAFERGRQVALKRFDIGEGLGPGFNVTFCTACHERPVFGGSAGLYRNFFLAGTLTEGGAFITPEFGGVLRKNSFGAGMPFFPMLPATLNVFAQRNPIPFFGVGLIAELEDDEIRSREDPEDADGDGISGRANFDRGFVGRFGRKAQTVSIEGFIRGPLNNHLGITSDPLSDAQRNRLPVDSSSGAALRRRNGDKPLPALQAAAPDGPLIDDDDAPDPELSPDDLFDLVSFAMLLAAPQPEEPTAQSERGRQLFTDSGCTACHAPSVQGPRGALPIYSDLLLHDMGTELADGIVQGEATGSEFRTQPLWGLSAVGPFLHDGRAETISEAILLHGGEAESSRDRFAALSESERDDIVEFLQSLGGRNQFTTGLIPPDAPVPDVGTYGGPVRALTSAESKRFVTGREVFDRDFGFSTGVGALPGADGLPRFNGDSCRACHFEPVFGGAGPRGVNVMRHGSVSDDGTFTAPATTVNTILHTQTRSSARPNIPEDGINTFEPRQTPHLFGAGLLDAITEESILANEDETDSDGDGISGRAHRIVEGERVRIGRFGWKAQVPSLAEFIRDGMAAELGVTLPPQEGLTFGTTEDDDGIADPELSLPEVEDLAFFLSMLAAPPRQTGSTSADAMQGQALFATIGCDKCHIASLSGILESQPIDVPLYSDLLLHDITPEGTAGIEDGQATQREFRTAPLWGLSQTAPYSHTGEADTIDASIRLHDGEAVSIRQAYESLSEDERNMLLAFLDTL